MEINWWDRNDENFERLSEKIKKFALQWAPKGKFVMLYGHNSMERSNPLYVICGRHESQIGNSCEHHELLTFSRRDFSLKFKYKLFEKTLCAKDVLNDDTLRLWIGRTFEEAGEKLIASNPQKTNHEMEKNGFDEIPECPLKRRKMFHDLGDRIASALSPFIANCGPWISAPVSPPKYGVIRFSPTIAAHFAASMDPLLTFFEKDFSLKFEYRYFVKTLAFEGVRDKNTLLQWIEKTIKDADGKQVSVVHLFIKGRSFDDMMEGIEKRLEALEASGKQTQLEIDQLKSEMRMTGLTQTVLMKDQAKIEKNIDAFLDGVETVSDQLEEASNGIKEKIRDHEQKIKAINSHFTVFGEPQTTMISGVNFGELVKSVGSLQARVTDLERPGFDVNFEVIKDLKGKLGIIEWRVDALACSLSKTFETLTKAKEEDNAMKIALSKTLTAGLETK